MIREQFYWTFLWRNFQEDSIFGFYRYRLVLVPSFSEIGLFRALLGASEFAEGSRCLSDLFREKCMMRLVSACFCWRDAFFFCQRTTSARKLCT